MIITMNKITAYRCWEGGGIGKDVMRKGRRELNFYLPLYRDNEQVEKKKKNK